MLPNSGSKVPKASDHLAEAELGRLLGGALRGELGSSARATKTIMRWTGASDRSARKWMHGEGAPSGAHLLALARGSERVMELLLELTGRSDLLVAVDIHAVEVALAKATGAVETLKRQILKGGSRASR